MTMELREEARQREADRDRLARRRERFARDLRTLAARPEGERFLRWLLEQGNIFAEDYQPGQLGAYAAGKKATAVRLWNLLSEHLEPDAFTAVTGRHEREGETDEGA